MAALRQADILFANKTEASRILGEQIAADVASTGLGRRRSLPLAARGRGAVHSTGGAVCRQRGGIFCSQASLMLPDNFIKGSTGAGDAFTAGFLSGVHDDRTAVECLLRGEYVAAASLTHLTPSLGVPPLDECLTLAQQFGFQESCSFEQSRLR